MTEREQSKGLIDIIFFLPKIKMHALIHVETMDAWLRLNFLMNLPGDLLLGVCCALRFSSEDFSVQYL